MSLVALSAVAASCKRPTPNNQYVDRRASRPRSCLTASADTNGTQTSGASPARSPVNPGGATPATANETPLMSIVLPTTARSALSLSRQKRSLITTVGVPVDEPSSAGSVALPTVAFTPRTWKKLPETYCTCAISPCPRRIQLTVFGSPSKASNPEKLRL